MRMHSILPHGCNGVLVWMAAKESPPLLPRPADPCTSAANDSVQQVSKGKHRKGGRYHHYDAEVQAKIAKHVYQHGNKSAALRFTQELGHCVSESSVRNTKEAYLRVLKSVPDPDEVVSLPHASLS